MSLLTRPHRKKAKVIIRDRKVAVYWQMFDGPPDSPANRDIPREPAAAFEVFSLVSHVVEANRPGWYQQHCNMPRFLRAEDVVLLEEAEAYFGAKIAAEPDKRLWRELRAHARWGQKDRAGVLADIDALRSVLPEADWYMLRADWQRRMEDGPAALADVAAAVEIAPQNRQALHLQASLRSEFAPEEAVGASGIRFLDAGAEAGAGMQQFMEWMELNTLVQAGRFDEAEQRLNAMPTALERAAMASQIAMTMHSVGQGDRATALVERILAELPADAAPDSIEGVTRAHLLNTLAMFPSVSYPHENMPERLATAERAVAETLRDEPAGAFGEEAGHRLPPEISGSLSQSNRALSLSLRGQARKESGDLAGAAEDYTALVQLWPQDIISRTTLVGLLIDLGSYDEVRPHLAWLVENGPFEETWFAQARVAVFDQDLDLALWAIEEALSVGYESAQLLNYRAAIHSMRGDHAAELADLTRAIELSDQPDATLFVNRGNHWLNTQRPAEALADYNRALELDPTCALALRNRSAIYCRCGKFREALADVERALVLEPNSKFGLNNRAWCLLFAPPELRNPTRAMADIRRAIALPWAGTSIPTETQVFKGTLGAVHAAQGDFAKAVELLEECVARERDPEDRARHEEMLASYRQGREHTPRVEYTL